MIEVIGVVRLVRRCGSVASVLALFAAMLAASPAKAEVSETGMVPAEVGEPAAAGVVAQASSGLCDVSGVSQFGDVAADGYGAAHILCARALGLTRGKADGSFGPDDDLTREQMAAFLVRLWRDVLDGDCPQGVSHDFEDVAGSFAEADIECLFGLGITKGTTASTFSPGATLSTAAVTLFVTRLLVRSGAAACDLSADEFQRAAACLTDLGVAASAGEALAPVAATRAMMAVYLVGAWHQASGRGQPPVSPTRPVVTAVVTNEAPLVVEAPDAGMTVSVPVGALADSARLVVTETTAVPHMAGLAQLAGPVFDVSAFSTSGKEITQLDAPAQLRFPASASGGDAVIASYNEARQRWIPVPTRVQDGYLVADVDHFSWWSKVVMKTRRDLPECTGSAPGWVSESESDLDDVHGELLACVSSSGSTATITVANNRGYPIVVRQSGAVAESRGTRSAVTGLYQWLYELLYPERAGDTVLAGLEDVTFDLDQPQTVDGHEQATTMHAFSEDWGWVFSVIGYAVDAVIDQISEDLLERLPAGELLTCDPSDALGVVNCAIGAVDSLKNQPRVAKEIAVLLGRITAKLNAITAWITAGLEGAKAIANFKDLHQSTSQHDPLKLTYQTRTETPTEAKFGAISAGGNHSCGILTDGRARCWGDNDNGQAEPPVGVRFSAISAGGNHSCGILTDGQARCWGAASTTDLRTDWGQTAAPTGVKFSAISAGYEHSCGILANGQARCWGRRSHGQTDAPTGVKFSAISAGRKHSCGILTNGRARCWGNNRYGQSVTPAGAQFSAISATGDSTCGILTDGRALCWGSRGSDPPADAKFKAISRDWCGILTNGRALCWGGWADVLNDVKLSAISIGWGHACGILADGRARCWGDSDNGQADPPTGAKFSVISAGRWHSCGVLADGRARCWGDNGAGQADPPVGVRFSAISAGFGHSCGVLTTGQARCWGFNGAGQADPPAGVEFDAISAGGGYSCGVLADGRARCWGNNEDGQADPPVGVRFSAISAGLRHSCGVLTTGQARCWGFNGDGRADWPIDVRFSAISAGDWHSCGVLADGRARCWGNNWYGQADPPADVTFSAISAGFGHSCGVLADGQARCWGSNYHGRADPPVGVTFSAISVGHYYSCGVLADGRARCWGDRVYWS